jgi:hypothetical protein
MISILRSLNAHEPSPPLCVKLSGLKSLKNLNSLSGLP